MVKKEHGIIETKESSSYYLTHRDSKKKDVTRDLSQNATGAVN